MRGLLPKLFPPRPQAGVPSADDTTAAELFARRLEQVRPVESLALSDQPDAPPVPMPVPAEPFVMVSSAPFRRLVVLDPLRTIDGRLHLHLGDGVVCPLRHGDPAGLHDGWSMHALYVGCDRLLWASLRHEHGYQSDWFLSDEATYLADAVESLPAFVLQALVRHVHDLLLTPHGAARDHALDSYGHMHLQTRHRIEAHLGTESQERPDQEADGQRLPAGMPPRDVALTPAARIVPSDFGRPSLFSGGWHREGDALALIAAEPGRITLDLPYRPASARLTLDATGSAVPRLLTVCVNGWTIGTSRMGPAKGRGSRAQYWIPAEALEAGPLTISLSSSTPSLATAPILTLDGIGLDLGPQLPATLAEEPDAALMARFESLGEDCEFGFVQRHFGIEPLGLFRFAGARHMRNLLRLLDTDLDGLGDPGSLSANLMQARLYRASEPPLVMQEFYMTDHRLDFVYHTFRGPEQEPEAEALALNEQKLRYLKRKFVEDLEDGDKIWLLKDADRSDVNEAFAFRDVLNRRGPNRLFWVTRVIPGRTAGSVEWLAPNLLRGYSDNAHADAQIFEPHTWLRLCRNAARAFAEREALAGG